MKRSVDLTEQRLFSDTTYEWLTRHSNSLYKKERKRIPWREIEVVYYGKNFQPAFIESFTMDGITNTVDYAGEYYIMDDVVSTIYEPVHNFVSRTVVYNNDEPWFAIDLDTDDTYENIELLHEEKRSRFVPGIYINFPTGRAKSIASKRQLRVTDSAKYGYFCKCAGCNQKKKYRPWTKETCYSSVCSDCVNDLFIYKRKIKDIKENQKNIWKDSKSIHNENSYGWRNFANTLRRLSETRESRRFFPRNKVKPWDFYESNMDDDFDIKSKAVKYKGITLHGRQIPWAPKGRIPQEYDTIFDNLDWKEMLSLVSNI